MSKQTILLTLVMAFCHAGFCFSQGNQPYGQTAVSTGISLGTAIAVAISWSKNQSILWAIIHGILSWVYVIYHALTR